MRAISACHLAGPGNVSPLRLRNVHISLTKSLYHLVHAMQSRSKLDRIQAMSQLYLSRLCDRQQVDALYLDAKSLQSRLQRGGARDDAYSQRLFFYLLLIGRTFEIYFFSTWASAPSLGHLLLEDYSRALSIRRLRAGKLTGTAASCPSLLSEV